MQELEKILEEIDAHAIEFEIFGASDDYISIGWVKDIIRKHMNDGWIPVDDKLPEKNEYFVETSSDKDFPNGYYKRLEIAYMTNTIEYVHGYYDGYKWMDKWYDIIENVVAWKIHEPYRPKGVITMTENEAIELLRSMQNPKQDYADVVCAPAFCTGFRFVYPEPEDYAIEEAIKALKEIQQYREIGTVEEFRKLKERSRDNE